MIFKRIDGYIKKIKNIKPLEFILLNFRLLIVKDKIMTFGLEVYFPK